MAQDFDKEETAHGDEPRGHLLVQREQRRRRWQRSKGSAPPSSSSGGSSSCGGGGGVADTPPLGSSPQHPVWLAFAPPPPPPLGFTTKAYAQFKLTKEEDEFGFMERKFGPDWKYMALWRSAIGGTSVALRAHIAGS